MQLKFIFDLQRFTILYTSRNGNTAESGDTSISAASIQGVLSENKGGTSQESLSAVTVGAANKLNTARTIVANLGSTVAGSFNGTANIKVGVQGTLPVARGGTGQTDLGKVSVGTAASLSGNASTATKLQTPRNILVSLGSNKAQSFDGSASITPGVTGTLPIARGGTGVTVNPSVLVNLAATTAAGAFQTAPRPGVTGTLPVNKGGTGVTTTSALRGALGLGTVIGALQVANGGTGVTTATDIKANKDGSGNVISTTYATKNELTTNLATKLTKLAGEYSADITTTATNQIIMLGEFGCSKTNITADITTTTDSTNMTRHGTAVLATTGVTSGNAPIGTLRWTVYDDPENYVTPNLFLEHTKAGTVKLYYTPAIASRNIIHLTVTPVISASNVFTTVTSKPTAATITASNSLRTNFVGLSTSNSVASSAHKLQTARNITVSLNATSTVQSFNGTAPITLGPAGTLPASKGGTGQTDLTKVTVGTATTASKDSAGNVISTTFVKKAGDTFTGNIIMGTNSVNAKGVQLPVNGWVGQLPTSGSFSGVKVIGAHPTNTGYGYDILVQGGNKLILAAGEGGHNSYNNTVAANNSIPVDSGENLYLHADGDIVFRSNMNNMANGKMMTYDIKGNLRVPGDVSIAGTFKGKITQADKADKADKATSAETADKATKDSDGNEIKSYYAKKEDAITKIVVSGTKATVTKADGTTSNLTFQDTNTHYTTKLIAGASTSTVNAATTNGNTYLRLFDNTTVRNNINVKGSGIVTVTSNASGVIDINAVVPVYSDVTTAKSGLMTADDKKTLDSINSNYLTTAVAASTYLKQKAVAAAALKDSNGNIISSTYVKLASPNTMSADITMGTNSAPKNIILPLNSAIKTNGAGDFSGVMNINNGTGYGSDLLVQAGQALILGAGAGGKSLYDQSVIASDLEHAYIVSDNNVSIITGTQTIDKKQVFSFDNAGLFTTPNINIAGTINVTGNAVFKNNITTTGSITSAAFSGPLSHTPTGTKWVTGAQEGNAIITSTAKTYGAIVNASTKNYRVAIGTYPSSNDNFYLYSITKDNITAETNVIAKQLTWNADTGLLTVNSVKGALDGNAASATKFVTARNITVSLASTLKSSFNGTADITVGTQGILPVSKGGTGQTSIAQIKSNLSYINRAWLCQTEATVAAKVTETISEASTSIGDRSLVCVYFANPNTADNPTLNINGSGARPIRRFNSVITNGANKTFTTNINQAVWFKAHNSQYWDIVEPAPYNQCNFVATAPTNPYNGQMFYNTITKTAYVYDGKIWLSING